MLIMRDFDCSKVGNIFELDEVTPKPATEEHIDDPDNKAMDNDDTPRKFNTDEVVGYKYSLTIPEDEYRTKSTQITATSLECLKS